MRPFIISQTDFRQNKPTNAIFTISGRQPEESCGNDELQAVCVVTNVIFCYNKNVKTTRQAESLKTGDRI